MPTPAAIDTNVGPGIPLSPIQMMSPPPPKGHSAGPNAPPSSSAKEDPATPIIKDAETPATSSAAAAQETGFYHHELEIKDPAIIFNSVWSKLEAKYGKDNMRFPQEIIWLGGAPGAGKGTNTPFIASVRGITAAPIVMSSLLSSDEAKKIKAQGGLVTDSYVFQTVMEELRLPVYRSGVVVDGFPRTTVQVECTNMLHEKMLELRKQYYNTPLGPAFPRPVFRVTVLFVEEKVAVDRQLKRGAAIREQNVINRAQGLPILEERETDIRDDAARKRYKIFRDHYSTLQNLKQHFPFTLIDASGSIEEVQRNIIKEFKYQSSLELSQETYDMVQRVPLVSDVIVHARGELVSRLDEYQYRHSGLFEQVISAIEHEFTPTIRRHAIAGLATIRTNNVLFEDALAVDMVLDVLSERGYHVMSDRRSTLIPSHVDPLTYQIHFTHKTEFLFQVRFQRPEIREHHDRFNLVRPTTT